MKAIKNWFVTFLSLFFPSIAAYRTHDKEIIEYIENNMLIETNCKRILYMSPILIFIPVWGLRGILAISKLSFVITVIVVVVSVVATIYTSLKISDALKVHGNGILRKRKYYEKLYTVYWIIWFAMMVLIGFARLNVSMSGTYLYLFQLCLAFFPLIPGKQFKIVGIFTVIFAAVLGINLIYISLHPVYSFVAANQAGFDPQYVGSEEMMIGGLIFIFTNMILVFVLSIILQKLNLSIAVLVAYVKQVGFLDQLTNLYNRRGYQFRMDEMVEDEIDAGVIMMDIDFFKQFNDTFGHNKGDEILKIIAKTIIGVTSHDTQLAMRYGGEEFAIICLNADVDVASIIANSIMKAINKLEIPTADNTVSNYLTVSIGIAGKRVSKNTSIDEVVSEADKALYEAKENGRNQIVIH